MASFIRNQSSFCGTLTVTYVMDANANIWYSFIPLASSELHGVEEPAQAN